MQWQLYYQENVVLHTVDFYVGSVSMYLYPTLGYFDT